MSNLPLIIEDSSDVDWENTLEKDYYDVELWLEYAQDKIRRGLGISSICMVYERALSHLPGSYKLWYTYLTYRLNHCTERKSKQLVSGLISTFERCLVYMNKMPNIWILYCKFLIEQKFITVTRETFDRALGALPTTQHDIIWNVYIHSFVLKMKEIPWKTCEKILRRRIKVDQEEGRAALVEFLKSRNRHGEAAKELFTILSQCKEEDQKKQVRLELVTLVRNHAEECQEFVNLEQVVRQVPKEAANSEERVKMFSFLAEFYIRLGEFDRARQIFFETIANECPKIKEFSTIYESFTLFEEAILDSLEEEEEEEGGTEVNFRIKRLRHLVDERKVIASKIFLDVYPQDIQERLTLASVYEKQGNIDLAEKVILSAFEDSDLELYNGQACDLFKWLAVSRKKQKGDGEEQALELGCKLCFELKDVVELWRIRIEREIAKGNQRKALDLAKQAITPPPLSNQETSSEGKKKPSPHRSPTLWGLYLDLEQSLGTFETSKAAYEYAMELKVCTVLSTLNYCKLLKEANYHEDSYIVYERAIAMFPWPHVKDLWVEYIKSFIERYSGTKLERTRDLFEQCIKSIPLLLPEKASEYCEFAFFSYAKFECDYGFSRRAMTIYERWCDTVQNPFKYDAYLIWANKAEELFGAPSVRKVFTRAMEVLPELDVAKICIRFSNMERRLGELERARAILKHGSQFCDPIDPKKEVGLWQAWNDFEAEFGNEETFREMLRVKRSVQAHYSVLHAADQVNFAKQQRQQAEEEEEEDVTTMQVENPDEIDIDEDEETTTNGGGKKMGALERLTASIV